ncbi:MAG: helix-turn-helix domain-containing protein [Actinomycetota bacterium]|nr:helix-turn-helix domain-containing protein [Actinomycetota bacterium]
MRDRIQASTPLRTRVQERREGLGLTQTQLAARAGVTRQLIGAVEAGRHQPNVGAALALAGVLGSTVEALFGGFDVEVVSVTGDVPPPSGAPVNVVWVGDRLVVVPTEHWAVNCEQWAVADGSMDGDRLALLPDAAFGGLVVAGCDPALGILAGLVQRMSAHRIITVHASTGRSVEALAGGRVHAIAVHAPAGRLPEPPLLVRRWRLARWQVGLASARPSGVPTVEEIAERRLRIVQREAGAGTQLAFARALHRVGGPDHVPGPRGDGHLDVARRISDRSGAAAGLTMEAAARSFGLSFEPLEEHVVELWLDAHWSATPAAVTLIEALRSDALRDRLGLIGGYDLSELGSEPAATDRPKQRHST